MLPWLLLPWLIVTILVGKGSYEDLKSEKTNQTTQVIRNEN